MNVERIAEVVEGLAPEQALDTVLAANENARVCLTSSFSSGGHGRPASFARADSRRARVVPGYRLSLPANLRYRDRMAKEWSLHLVNVLPTRTVPEQESAFGMLYQTDPTRCCQFRKVEPLLGALEPFDVLVYRIAARTVPDAQEPQKGRGCNRLPRAKTLWKVSLLADWNWEQVLSYMNANGISHLPQ